MLDAQMDYLERIGAVDPVAEPDEDSSRVTGAKCLHLALRLCFHTCTEGRRWSN